MNDNLEGLIIKKQEQSGSTLKLTLSNGKVLSVFQNNFSYVNENTFDFNIFNEKKLTNKIFDFLESNFFSLSELNSDMYTELEKEDLLSSKVIIDKDEDLIQIYLEFPIEILKGKTIGWEDDWYEDPEEIIRNRENVQEFYYLDLNRDRPNAIYKFLELVVEQ